MSEDWDRPITKPLPGPVASEAMQMNADELRHVAFNHSGQVKGCPRCSTERWNQR